METKIILSEKDAEEGKETGGRGMRGNKEFLSNQKEVSGKIHSSERRLNYSTNTKKNN